MDDAELARLAAGIKMGNNAAGNGATGKGYSGIFEKKPAGAKPKAEAERLEPIAPPPKPAPRPSPPPPAAAATAESPGGGPQYTAMFKDVRDGANVPSFPAPSNPKPKSKKASGGCGCVIL